MLSIRNAEAVRQAAKLVRAGELIIIPTDTIYGIAAYPGEASIERLYAVRGRTEREPALPLLMAELDTLSLLTRPRPAVRRLAQRLWPGPLTLILPPAPGIAAPFNASPLALRVPNFPDLLPFLKAVGGYVLVSGAIRSGHSPAITAQEAAQLFPTDIALILDGGPAPYGIPSTIVDCLAEPPIIVRRGAIPPESVWAAFGEGAVDGTSEP